MNPQDPPDKVRNLLGGGAIPDFFEPLIGYRQWAWDRGKDEFTGKFILNSVTGHIGAWVPKLDPTGEIIRCCTATCRLSGTISCKCCGEENVIHPAPQRGCHCGMYAFKDPVAFLRQLPPPPRTRMMRGIRGIHDSRQINGIIRIWGRIIEHRNGWRAEHAWPALLCHENSDVLEKLQETYPGTEIFVGSFPRMIATIFDDPNVLEEFEGGHLAADIRF